MKHVPRLPLSLDSEGDIVDSDGHLLAVVAVAGTELKGVFLAAPDLLSFAKQVLDYATDAECFYLMSLAENIIQKVGGKR